MDTFEPKKAALIRILQILQQETDIDHPLKHHEIVDLLDKKYGLTVERKAIGRNISLLNEMGYDIVTTKQGAYLAERTFEDSELRLLIDNVLAGKHVTEIHSRDLINKICSLSNKYFKPRVKHIYRVADWDKTENSDLFYNIEIADEAISENKQVYFRYNKYGADKTLRETSKVTASPYQMILHNQRYYLMAYNDYYKQMNYYRLDRITNIVLTDVPRRPLHEIKSFENGIDYKRFSAQMPYMFGDEIKAVTFVSEPWAIDQIVDWFGKDIDIKPKGEKYLVSVKTSLRAMEFWAMQYLNAVEILTPTSLRDKLRENLIDGVKKYTRN
mgnify:CR=1 FL=1